MELTHTLKKIHQKINSIDRTETARELAVNIVIILLLGGLLLGALWQYVLQKVNYDYEMTIDEVAHESMNWAIAFEEHVLRILSDADRDLLNLIQVYKKEGIGSPLVNSFIDIAGSDPIRLQVAIVDEEGVQVACFVKRGLGMNVADREFYQFHRHNPSESSHVGRTFTTRTSGQKNFTLSRRIDKPDGSFGGVVVIGLKTDYFLDYYNKIDLGPEKVVLLTGRDGFDRVRQWGDSTGAERDIRGDLFLQNIQSGLPAGSFIEAVGGINRVVSYRVMPDYPLVVATAKSTGAEVAEFEARRGGYIGGAMVTSLLLVSLFGLIIDRQRKQYTLQGRLEVMVRERTQEVEKQREKLADANSRLSAQARLLDLAHDYIMVTGPDGKIVYWNKGAEAGYGWAASEAMGKVARSLLKTQYSVSPAQIMDSLLRAGHWTGELVQTGKDGMKLVIQSQQTLHRDADGNPLSILEINRDITEQKKYETEIARLDRLNLIGEMAAGIGHEVRNPLTTVRGYLQQFTRKADFAEHYETIAVMIEEIDRANGIISEFLGLAKNRVVELTCTDLNKVIRSLYPLMQADALRRGSVIELELQSIPAVIADEKEMRQCILNLVGNGLDAMPGGGKLTIGTAESGNRVIMMVRDRGTGIPPEVKDKIGTPFFTTKDNGTGLGLLVCYRIAQRHQASIEMETGPDGTAFHFIFSNTGRNDHVFTAPNP